MRAGDVLLTVGGAPVFTRASCGSCCAHGVPAATSTSSTSVAASGIDGAGTLGVLKG